MSNHCVLYDGPYLNCTSARATLFEKLGILYCSALPPDGKSLPTLQRAIAEAKLAQHGFSKTSALNPTKRNVQLLRFIRQATPKLHIWRATFLSN